MDLSKIKIFYAVVKAGSFTKAAKTLGLTQPSINKSMRILEKEAGCTLFTRHKYGVKLTKHGERLCYASKVILNELRLVEDYFKNDISDVKNLIITTSIGISSDWLIKFLRGFLKINNTISLKIVSHPQDINIDFNEADIAICPALTSQSHIIQKRLCSFDFKLYASNEYLKEYGKPKDKNDLKNHRLITFPSEYNIPFSEVNSLFNKADNMSSIVEINSSIGEYRLVEAGVGIGALCDKLTIFDREKIIDIFPDDPPVKVDIFYIYHRKTSKSKEVEEFFNYLKNNLEKENSETKPSNDDLKSYQEKYIIKNKNNP